MLTTFIAALAATALLLLVVANAFAPARFAYPQNLQRLDRFVAQVFVVHSIYVAVIVLAMAALALAAAVGGLSPASTTTRVLHGLAAAFWLSRVALQLFYYDKALRRDNRGWDVLFLATFVYLTAAFTFLALTP